ncbi:MAG: cytidylate kinase family protein [Clostridiales bacterium]|jgi:cytidylate kinase|nr:cytidylate kinase family protein [Clostridiales bacterium]
MIISLSGQLGSGKSTLCAYFKEQKGFEIFSTGTIHRRLAKEMNLSTLEFNALLAKDKNTDLLIDGEMKKYARENSGRDIVFDSRLAWHFIKESFKVFLLVAPAAAARRVFSNRVSEEEKYSSLEDAAGGLIRRRAIETERFNEFYGVDCDDYENYDLIVDTSDADTETAAKIILSAYAAFSAKRPFVKYRVSPKNVYPTRKFSEIGRDLTKPIKLARAGGALFITEGHKTVAEAIAGNEKIICAEASDKRSGEAVCKTLGTGAQREIIADWEDKNGFVFGYYLE